MTHKVLFSLAGICFFYFANGQKAFSIRGTVADVNGKAIEFANVLLLQASDSSLVKGALTDEIGAYVLDPTTTGRFYVMVNLIGYNTVYSEAFELESDYTLASLTLTEGETLNEVVIMEKKPLFMQKVDRMVINVENSVVSAGGTALEVLERSPGVLVNRQNNSISIAGKDGVVVLINGKTTYVPSNAIVQMLQGMSASSISAIELLTTPPSNYDAEGNAGFINIVMKKRMDIGLNGAYAFSLGYGKGLLTNDNIDFNYRKGKINLYGSYSYRNDARTQQFITSRMVMKTDTLELLMTISDREPVQRNHNIRVGLDVDAGPSTILGFLVNAYDNKWSMDARNHSHTAYNGVPSSSVILNNREVNLWQHLGTNFSIKHNFSSRKSISMDLDYLHYLDDNPNDYDNEYYDGNSVFIRQANARSRKKTPITTWVGKLDYITSIGENITFESGVKGTTSAFTNDVSVANLADGEWLTDYSLTNKSILDEKIMAAYTSMDWKVNERWSAKAGLRYEYTNSKLETSTQGRVVDRQYGILFPTVYLNRKISEMLNMNWSYTRRITRPTFNELAPFVILFDPNTFISGNAALQPAITDAVKYDIGYKSYFLSLQYAYQDSTIVRFQERIDKATGRLIFESANLSFAKTYSATISVPVDITSWWRNQNNINLVYQKVKAYRESLPVEIALGNYSINTSHFFNLKKGLSFELSGSYTSPGISGVSRFKAIYGVNGGIEKKLSDRNGSLKFSVSDLFDSFKWQGSTNIDGQNFETNNTFDFSNRTFLLTYSRNFGRKEVKSARSRATGAEDERKRVN